MCIVRTNFNKQDSYRDKSNNGDLFKDPVHNSCCLASG